MLHTLTLLLLYQAAGELISRLFALPIPGPVIGMALLFLTLRVKGRVGEETRADTAALLRHLSLLFVPAGVGIVAHLDRVTGEWLPITLALVVSTFAGLAVTAGVVVALSPKRPPAEGEATCD